MSNQTPEDIFEQLSEINNELRSKSIQARRLMRSLPEEFDFIKQRAHAYRVCDFGRSDNQYDITFDVIVDEIEENL